MNDNHTSKQKIKKPWLIIVFGLSMLMISGCSQDVEAKLEKGDWVYDTLIPAVELVVRDEKMYDNGKGDITFLGENYQGTTVFLFYWVTGDISYGGTYDDKPILESFHVKAIFDDGSYYTADPSDRMQVPFSEGKIVIDVIENPTEAQLVRLDYKNFDKVPESKDLKEIDLETLSFMNQPVETHVLDEIRTVRKIYEEEELDLHFQTPSVEINITQLALEQEEGIIHVRGTITPSEDIMLEKTYIYIPSMNYRFENMEELELFEGITTNFERIYEIPHSLPEPLPYISLGIHNALLHIDFNNGQTFEVEKQPLVQLPFFQRSEKGLSDFERNVFEKGKNATRSHFQDYDGNMYINAISLQGGYNTREEESIPVSAVTFIGGDYHAFKAKVGLLNQENEDEIGTIELNIKGDGKLLEKVDVSKDIQTINVEVSDVHELDFEVVPFDKKSAAERVMIADGYFE